jgi:hypothetical protein
VPDSGGDRTSFSASEEALTVIDLRLVCNEPRDYANPIEPSSHGGAKIAKAILRVFEERSVGRIARVFGP